jgi:hypothetical protein
MLVSAFTRSGQTFTRHALELLYGIDLPETNHTVRFLQENENVLVTFRNPLDAIASWHYFQVERHRGPDLLADIAFWKRYYTYVVGNPENLTLLDFDKFTVDLDYLVAKVGQEPVATVTIDDVKAHMATNEKDQTHLPTAERDAATAAIKAELETMPEFQELLPLYEQLKALAE